MPEFKIINESEFNRRGIILWRYFDLHKFINFLHTGELRFTRMDNFDDPLEGVPLRALIEYAEEKDIELITNESLSDLILDSDRQSALSPKLQKRIKNIKTIQQSTFVSCWFLGNRESMAMWNLYSNSDGVGVYLPARNLFHHFSQESELLEDSRISFFYSGKVHYQDFKSINAYEDNKNSKLPKVALRKDISYKHEEEFRFVVRKKHGPALIPFFSSSIKSFADLRLKVVCHPQMAVWKKENIKRLLEKSMLSNSFKESEIRLRAH